jgi:D-serine deaminase-like pyridoxal phosphate-dependent protein
MAAYIAANGWADITIAFPVNILEIEQINFLAGKIKLGLLVEDISVVEFLKNNLSSPVDVWIKVDVGNFRTGILWDKKESFLLLAEHLRRAKNLNFKGLLTHSGHAYRANTQNEIVKIYSETVERMNAVRESLQASGFSRLDISIGDTPCCSVIDDFSEVDEIRPGNFVFYDVAQLKLGTCSEEQIAVAVACPVVAKHAERIELVIYGGAIHLSKDFLLNEKGKKVFGLICQLHPDGWSKSIDKTFVSAISQEHGIIKTSTSFFNQVKIGDLLAILPVHSCLTVNELREFTTLDGLKFKAL